MPDTETAASTSIFSPNSHKTPRGGYFYHFIEVETGSERWSDLSKVTQLVKRHRGDLNPRGVTVWLQSPYYPSFVHSPIFSVPCPLGPSPPSLLPGSFLLFLLPPGGRGWRQVFALGGTEGKTELGIRGHRAPQTPNQGCCSWERIQFLGGWRTHSEYLITISRLIWLHFRLNASNKELMLT